MTTPDHAAALRALAVQAKRLGLHRTAASLDLDADEAARREAEGVRSPRREVVLVDGKPSIVEMVDAPPPTAPFVTDHKWLDPECHASGCQTLILKAELEKLRDQRDKYMWQVRDTCARAEAAEADAKRLREALVAIMDDDNGVADIRAIARSALAQGGNDG